MRCSKLWYSYPDYKAFLVIHALERLFPDVVFFPFLSEIVIIPSRRSFNTAPGRPLGLRTPFSLIGRASALTIFDEEVIAGHIRCADEVFQSLARGRLPEESLENLQAVSYVENTRPFAINRMSQPCKSRAPSN